MHAVRLEQLDLFLQTCQAGSISAAARSLGMSASLATRKLAALENEIGSRLLNRSTRRIALTPAGEILREWASSSMQSFETAIDAIAAQQQRPSGLVRLACSDFIALTYLPELLMDFRKSCPEIDISVLTVEREVKLVNENFDVAIHSGKSPDGLVIGRKMWDIQTVLCASPAFIAEFGTPSQPDELNNYHCIAHAVFESETWNFQHGDQIIRHSVRPNVRSTNALVQKELAIKGLGITSISKRVVASELADGTLVQILPDFKCVLDDGHLMATWIVFPHRDMLHRTRIFVDALIQHFQRFV